MTTKHDDGGKCGDRDMSGDVNIGERSDKSACDCTHSLSMFCASLISQDWMQDERHAPAVQCKCGKRYWSYREKRAFNSKVST